MQKMSGVTGREASVKIMVDGLIKLKAQVSTQIKWLLVLRQHYITSSEFRVELDSVLSKRSLVDIA